MGTGVSPSSRRPSPRHGPTAVRRGPTIEGSTSCRSRSEPGRPIDFELPTALRRDRSKRPNGVRHHRSFVGGRFDEATATRDGMAGDIERVVSVTHRVDCVDGDTRESSSVAVAEFDRASGMNSPIAHALATSSS